MSTTPQSYPAYKPSGVPWLGDVPAHWEVRRLRSVADVINGATPSTNVPNYWDGHILWVTPDDLGRLRSRYVTDSARQITEEGYRSCGTSMAPANSLAVSTRAPIGHLGILQSEGCVNQGCRLLIPGASIQVEYLHYTLSTGRSDLASLGRGSTFTELSRTQLSAFRFPLPPLPEQRAIVRYLDYVDRRIRRYVAAKRKLMALLEEEKQAIVNQAVTRGLDPNVRLKPSGVEWLGDVPEHWEVRRLRSLASIGTGGRDTINREDDGQYPFFVRSQSVERINTWSFDGEAVLTAGDGVGVGKVFHYVNGMFDYHQRVYKFSNFRHIAGKYFFHYFRSTLRNEVFQGTAKSTVDSLRLPMLQNFPVAFPPLLEQHAIVENLEDTTASVDPAITRARRQIELIEEYRTRLIADVVTGKLDVREQAAPPESPAECNEGNLQ